MVLLFDDGSGRTASRKRLGGQGSGAAGASLCSANKTTLLYTQMNTLITVQFMSVQKQYGASDSGLLPELALPHSPTALTPLVSAPDPNQPQRGSLPVLDAIRAGVGLGLGPRL